MNDRSSSAESRPADDVLEQVLDEIAVPKPVLEEARTRRTLVLDEAAAFRGALEKIRSGSIAHGVHNKLLEDADGAVKLDRRQAELRGFGPDAPSGGAGPNDLIADYAAFLEPRLQARGYPDLKLDLDGNRAIKVVFGTVIDFDGWGPVDPYVDLILGLAMSEQSGIWIPDRRHDAWDPADPSHHTWLMTKRDPKRIRVFRARIVRLAKRAIKRDSLIDGRVQVVHSWNVSALSLELLDEPVALARGLAYFFSEAAASLRRGLTEDPSPVVTEPISLPDGVSRTEASDRLEQMADVVLEAEEAPTKRDASDILSALFGVELDAIRERDLERYRSAHQRRDKQTLGAVLGAPAGLHKITGSGGH